MVDKIRELLAQVKRTRGSIKLFAMFKESPDINRWTFIISAPWLDALQIPVATMLWTNYLAEVLNHEEQKSIARISILKTNDKFVDSITNMINVSGEPVELNKYLGDIFRADALVFESVKSIQATQPQTNRRAWELNPYRNPNINIYRNPNINPFRNPNINPYRNPNINPFRNPNINPYRNPNINIYRNPNINIYRNPNINPFRNPAIRPNSHGFNGLHLYDTNIVRIGYFIMANDDVIIRFDLQNNFKGIGVKDSQNGYVLFDENNTWTGQLVFAEQNVFVHFRSDNDHQGYAASF